MVAQSRQGRKGGGWAKALVVGDPIRQPPNASALVDAEFTGQNGQLLPDGIESIHHRDEAIFGVGDLELRLSGGVLRPGTLGDLLLDVGVGVALPTGRVEENPFARGRNGLEHQHVFFGGGTVRPIVSLAAVYPLDSVTLTAFGEAQLSLYAGPEDYTPPSLVVAGLGAQIGFGLTSWRFLLQQELFHEVPARWGDERAENSGRTDLIGTAGAAWLASPAFRPSLLVRVPYYTFGAGDPITIPAVVSLSMTATLDTQEEAP